MPTSRQILDLLTRDDLAHLVEQNEINLGGKARGHMLDRLEEKGPGLAGLLSGLLRPRLAELCAQLGLSDGPKDKGALVARLSASASPEPAPGERGPLPISKPAASGKTKNSTMQIKLDDAIPTNGRAAKPEGAPGTPKPKMASSPPPASDRAVSWIASFIWGIADDVLRDLYVRGKYRDVILPMTVLSLRAWSGWGRSHSIGRWCPIARFFNSRSDSLEARRAATFFFRLRRRASLRATWKIQRASFPRALIRIKRRPRGPDWHVQHQAEAAHATDEVSPRRSRRRLRPVLLLPPFDHASCDPLRQ